MPAQILGQQVGEDDAGRATLRAQNGKMVSSSKGKREVLVEHYRKLTEVTNNLLFGEMLGRLIIDC